MDYHKNQLTLSTGKLPEKERLKNVFEAKKISEATEAEVKNMLKMCFATIGISVLPDEFSKQILIESVFSDFKRFSLADIPEAFKMIVRNELTGNFEHFQNFSPMYLGKVMAAYDEFKGKQLVKMRQERKLIEQRQEPEDNRSQEEKDQESYEVLLKVLKDTKQEPIGWNWLNVYRHMDRSGLIDMDNEEKRLFADIVRERIKNEALTARSNGADQFKYRDMLRVLEDDKKRSFQNRCREEYVRNFCKEYLKSL